MRTKKLLIILWVLITFKMQGIATNYLVNSTTVNGINISSASYVVINGYLQNNAGATIVNNGNIYLKGNFTNNGTFTSGSSSLVKFYGTVSQQISTSTTLELNDAIIDNAAGVTLNFGDVQIDGTITFTNGGITTSTNTLVIENNNTAAMVSYDQSKYVNGNLKRKVAATGSYDFPVGTFSNYELANVNLVASTITYLTCFYTQDNVGIDISGLGLTVSGTPITVRLDYGWWTITPEAGSATNYDVTITSRGHTNGGADPAQHTVLKGTGSTETWATLGTHDNATQSGTGTNPITAKRTALNGFSDFCIARSNEAPLPIELISFFANCESGNIKLKWETASEINNDYFTIERCSDKDGVCQYNSDWEYIGTIDGAGNSNYLTEYSFTDVPDISQYNGNFIYYRLKQTDFDGTSNYYNTTVTSCSNDIQIINIYPNPAKDNFDFIVCSSDSGNVDISVINSIGQKIYNNKTFITKGENTFSIDVSGFVPALYMLHIVTADGYAKDSKQFLVK